MIETSSFKHLILRVVLRRVSPMVIRLVSASDQIKLPEFHQIFCAMLGWNGDLGYIVRIHGKEFNSFRRKTRSKALDELELHRQEKFLYICDILHMWEWDVRVLDIQEGSQQTVRQEATDAVDAAGRPSFATDADQGPQQRARGDVPPMVPAVPSRLTPDFLALSAQIQDVSLDNSALGDTPVLNQTPIGMLFTILFARAVSQKHDSARL